MAELFWRALAWFVSRRPVADWIVRRAMHRPYEHIPGYMNRWWLFNAYPTPAWFPLSVRVHQIKRADNDRHLHDHPWDFRTIVLMGWYDEMRPYGDPNAKLRFSGFEAVECRKRRVGDTYLLRFGEFHKIVGVSPEVGAVTLFITWRKRGTWGFKVGDRKIPWREYHK